MKASKLSDAQKAFIIRQGEEGTPVEEVCRKAGISQETYYAWKKKYGGMMHSEIKRMRESLLLVCHRSTLSKKIASGKPGAVHCR